MFFFPNFVNIPVKKKEHSIHKFVSSVYNHIKIHLITNPVFYSKNYTVARDSTGQSWFQCLFVFPLMTDYSVSLPEDMKRLAFLGLKEALLCSLGNIEILQIKHAN